MTEQTPMTQEQLNAIQERVDAVQADPPDEDWSYGAGIAWVPFCEHAREDIPALLAEVKRLRALTTVDDAMVERAARALADDANSDDWEGQKELAQTTLLAALGTQEDA